jgi:uncharacterized membrane protein YoaK (UPF0700 family)
VLYGNESISHYSRSNVSIWMLMAFQAGMINVGGFMACHRFVSHVTGFAAFFGVEVSAGQGLRALGMLTVPLFFLLGAMLSAQIVDIRLKLHKRPKYYLSFGLMFLILAGVFFSGAWGYLGKFGEPVNIVADYILLAALCLVCGLQNGTVTSVSKSVIRTTHLTGITTDLGIGLVRFFNRKKLREDFPAETYANGMRAGIIFFFGMGSLCGAIIFAQVGYLGFAIPALSSGVLFLAMYHFQVRKVSA